MKSKTLATLASVVVMSASTITLAQERGRGDPRGGPPGGRDGGPPMGAGPERGPPQGVQERRSAPNVGERRAAPQERSGPRDVNRERGASEKPQRRERAEQPRRPERSAAERERVRPKSENDNMARGAKDDQKRERATQQNRTPPNVQRGEAERRETARDSSARPNSKVAERRERLHQTRERLGREERQRFRSAFDFRSARVTNVRFNARIGTRIPRHVRLHEVPRTIIALIPDYTYYRYVVIDDVVCIVDPDTYEIVDVIDEGYYTVDRPQVASLDLRSWERALILDSISPDFPQAEVRLRLALGAEIPTHVEIHSFPEVVLDRIPRLRRFGFIVAQDDVVIADPSDHAILAVLER